MIVYFNTVIVSIDNFVDSIIRSFDVTKNCCCISIRKMTACVIVVAYSLLCQGTIKSNYFLWLHENPDAGQLRVQNKARYSIINK